jgi:hypothetical protein
MSKVVTDSFVTDMVGLSEEEATRRLEIAGFRARVTQRDGVPLISTADMRIDRLGLDIENGIVVATEIG